MSNPTEEKLEYEINLARNDLEANIAELKHAIVDELDVGKQARKVADKVKAAAAEVIDRKRLQAKMYVAEKSKEVRAAVVADPMKAAAIGIGVLAAIVGGVMLYRRMAD
ncbi:MAG: hypothetical protein H0T46_04100 [Deltaproteobacteria bacterium]|nr:hypothetical protein [Deltaproteobacteria bacterium]